MSQETLDKAQVEQALTKLPGWKLEEGKIHRDFDFGNFVTAFAWMSACAMWAEKLNHHPEWFNVWSKVSVDLRTHSADGITELDIKLAKKMNKLAEKFGGS